MRTIPKPMARLLIAACLVGLAFVGRAEQQESGGRTGVEEPPAEIRLEVDGRVFKVREGETTPLRLGEDLVQVKVTVGDRRRLELPGLSLEYPADWRFEIQDVPSATIRTFNGSDAMMMVFHFPRAEQSDLALRTSSAISAVSNFNSKGISARVAQDPPDPLTAGEKELSGTRVHIEGRNNPMFQDIYSLTVGEDVYLIMLQDRAPHDGRLSEQASTLRQMIEGSLRIKR